MKTRVRADEAAPSLADLNDASITQWANEETSNVIDQLKDAQHFPSLTVRQTSLTFSSGSASLPTSYQRYISVTVTANSVTYKRCRIFENHDEFNRYDSSNFILTPTTELPIVLMADKVYVRPSSITAGKIDYIKSHPTISASQDTVFDDTADNLLLSRIAYRYYMFIEEFDLAANVLKEVQSYGN